MVVLSIILEWFLPVSTWIFFVSVILQFFFKDNILFVKYIPRFATLIKLFVGALIINATLFTVGQYYLWNTQSFTEGFLNAPLTGVQVPLFHMIPWIFGSKLGYFIFYSFSHFWFEPILAGIVASAIYGGMRILKKHKERFFDDDEIRIGTLIALLVGWPNVIVFIIIAWCMVILYSLVNIVLIKQQYTAFGIPFFIAGIFTLLWGNKLLILLNLGVLKV